MIRPNPAQPRKCFDEGALAELADSIRRYGVLQPLTVRRRSRGYELVSGERRLRAAKIAGLPAVPCIVLDVDTSESSVLALIENLHRRDLDFIEEAEGLAQLIDNFGLSQEEAARRVGKSQSAVANKLRILRLPENLLGIIRKAGLTERHARALLRLGSDEERARALRIMIDEGMNVAQAEAFIENILQIGPEQAEPIAPREKPPAKMTYILKDVRLFINTLNHGMDVLTRSGINADCRREETDTDVILTITLPKNAPKRAGADGETAAV